MARFRKGGFRGAFATIDCKPRQVRKEAAVTIDSGAGVWLLELPPISERSPYMTYQVLARKWRPKTFSELVGQQHVITALTNSIANNKLHHAYLFTGTRGVGKTTIARVLAKALNCEQGPTVTPCLTCPTCVSIADGRYVDLIEVDAASRTRVEDTKELLDNVQYMPSLGRYKIYLIDEIHMLSGHSFNALLKTLEEPPAHVIFLLATTDPQKIPVTVLSRCLQFTLKPLSVTEIANYLGVVLKGENIEAEEKALQLLAKAANGSLRDSLSLLDQAIAYSDGTIQYKATLAMLSTVDDLCIHRLLAAIAKEDGERVLSLCQSMATDGVDFGQVLERFIEILHEVVVLQCVPKQQVQASLGVLNKFAQHFSKQDIQLFYEICLKGKQALGSVSNASISFEMTMLRMMTFKLSKAQPLTINESSSTTTVKTGSMIEQSPIDRQHQQKKDDINMDAADNKQIQPVLAEKKPLMVAEKVNKQLVSPKFGGEEQSWAKLVEALPLAGMARTVIMHCNLIEKNEVMVRLGLEENYQAMLTSTARNSIETALKQHWQCQFKLSFEVLSNSKVETPAARKTRVYDEELKQAKEELSLDPCFNEIVSRFDGQVEASTAKLIKE